MEPTTTDTSTTEALEMAEIQGIVLYGYGHLPYTCYLLLQIDDAARARAWLAEIAHEVISDARPVEDRSKRPAENVNIAFTAAGLRALDLGSEVMDTFPEEFRDGMSRPDRARALGDNGASDPAHWEFGGNDGAGNPARQPHVLLLLFAADKDRLSALYEREKARWERAAGGVRLLLAETEVAHRDGEQFGFRDGIANPVIAGAPGRKSPSERPLRAGEFVLGYRNEYDTFPFSPAVPAVAAGADVLPPARPESIAGTPEVADAAGDARARAAQKKDLGRNGSYLVYRKLRQDVAGFWRYCAAQAEGAAGQERIAAKMMGRWPNGAPLARYPDPPADGQTREELDDFRYAREDPHGFHCPIGAHIRRAHPRDDLTEGAEESLVITARHRILRRGRAYGPPLENPRSGVDDGVERGLIFIAIAANIARQFEFVQQTWMNNPKFHDLYEDRDPISGDNDDPVSGDDAHTIAGDIPCRFTIPQRFVRRRLQNVPRFVTVRGGAYFFVPSLSALCFLAGVPRRRS